MTDPASIAIHLTMLAGKTFFVGLGAPKCGTSWLSTYLDGHPEVLMSPIWEVRYFRSDSEISTTELNRASSNIIKQVERSVEKLRRKFAQPEQRAERLDKVEGLLDRLRMFSDDGAYLEMFRKRIKPQHRVFGEHSPAYSTLGVTGYAAIKERHNPVRVIFIMRDPVERHWSHVWFQLQPKNKKSNQRLAADEAIRARPAAVADHLAATLNGTIGKRGRYDLTLEAMDKVFAPEETLLLFYEQLFTSESIRRITDFLGISPKEAAYEKPVNRNRKKTAITPEFAALIREFYSPVYDYCHRRFGVSLPDSWNI